MLHYQGRKGRKAAELNHPYERDSEFSGNIVTSAVHLSWRNICRFLIRIQNKLLICCPCSLTESHFLRAELSLTLNWYLLSFCPAPDCNLHQDRRGKNYDAAPFFQHVVRLTKFLQNRCLLGSRRQSVSTGKVLTDIRFCRRFSKMVLNTVKNQIRFNTGHYIKSLNIKGEC